MGDLLVLCYHALSERWPAVGAVPPERFADQLEELVEAGYRAATLSDALADSPAGKTLAVTFDDGYRSVLLHAFPILERLGIRATVFVATAFPGAHRPLSWPGIDHWAGGPFAGELTPMSWKELRALADAGWEIGSHTHSHPRLTEVDDARLRDELVRSRDECRAAIGRECSALAYPYGAVDARVVRAARETGYVAGAALGRAGAPSSRLCWPRIGIYRRDGMLRYRLKVSPGLRALRGLR